MFPRKKIKKSNKKIKERTENLLHLLKHGKKDVDEKDVGETSEDLSHEEEPDVNAMAEMKANELEAIEIEVLQKRAKNEAPERGYQGSFITYAFNHYFLSLS